MVLDEIAIGGKVTLHPKTNKAQKVMNSGLGKTAQIIDINGQDSIQVAPLGNLDKNGPHSVWIGLQGDKSFRVTPAA